jgi:ribulose-5-phosphate 4-epimerase/fuculose-1-phosphate aldolase
VKFHDLEVVALTRDLPEHGLHEGDTGTVVFVHEPDGLEVEFMDASGRTVALVTLTIRDVQPTDPLDRASLRGFRRPA